MRIPRIAQRPLSSVVEMICGGTASGLLARMVAPLIPLPSVSLTMPVARAVWAYADPERVRAENRIRVCGTRRITGPPAWHVGPRPRRPLSYSLPEQCREAGGPCPTDTKSELVELIQHQIDDDSGDRYIQPQGQRPPRDPDVTVE